MQPNRHKHMARALIIEGGRLLVFFRRRFDIERQEWLEYYSFPGGEIELDETVEAAAIREAKEEMGIDIRIIRKVAVQRVNGFTNHVFQAEIMAGAPQLMPDSEEVFYSSEVNYYEVRWVDILELNSHNLLYYSGLLPVIQNLSRGVLTDEPVEILV